MSDWEARKAWKGEHPPWLTPEYAPGVGVLTVAWLESKGYAWQRKTEIAYMSWKGVTEAKEFLVVRMREAGPPSGASMLTPLWEEGRWLFEGNSDKGHAHLYVTTEEDVRQALRLIGRPLKE